MDEGAREEAIRFTGRAGEYYGIWLANLVLGILTLGVFSAWAKVRRKRYFLGHTFVLGDRLDYHARGGTILKGRLAVVAALLAYGALGYVDPLAQSAALVALVGVWPWLLNRALAFDARMTSWRNVRFDWHGRYWGVMAIYTLWPLAAVLTLGLLTPIAARAARHYLANHYALGRTRFAAATPQGPWWAAFLGAILIAALFGVPCAAIARGIALAVGRVVTGVDAGDHAFEFTLLCWLHFLEEAAVLAFALLSLLPLWLGIVFFRVQARNIVVEALTLGDAARFHSRLRPLGYFWILVSNAALALATALQLYPWAQIRRWRYLAQRTAVTAPDPAAVFVAGEAAAGDALADAASDIGGIEIGL